MLPATRPLWRPFAALATGAVAVTFALATPAAAIVARSTPSVTDVVSATKKAIAGQSSVRLTRTATGKSQPTTLIVEDEGKSSGLQTVSAGKAAVYVRFNKTDAYLSGNTKGLSTIFGLSAAKVKLVGAKWILVKSGTSQYSSIASSSEIGTVATEVLPASTDKVAIAGKTVNGEKADELTWSESSSGTKLHHVLDVAATGKSLPIKLTISSATATEVTLFSHWNEAISVITPKSTIPISKIIG